MPGKYIAALDQGTTSSRAILFDRELRIAAVGQRELPQLYPQPGWVEQDPKQILSTQLDALSDALRSAGASSEDILCIGIANQRETTVVWDKRTGEPVCNAIVWQCRRTSGLCERIRKDGMEPELRRRTGLLADAYFSATKLQWILQNVPGAAERASCDELLFGTVDSWLIWNLTGGQSHVTDRTNASRTLLYNIRELAWDPALCEYFGVPSSMLPQIRSSGELLGAAQLGEHSIPIYGAAGDQQAALFGQACFAPGDAKNTYGTGCFLLMNTGDKPCESGHGLLTTLCATVGNHVQYALEGSVFVAGALIQWLRDELRFFDRADQSETMAMETPDSGGVYVVPAFTGLGAPYWDMYARGTIVGLTRGSGRSQITRACLEAIAYQVKDVLSAMTADTGISLSALRADGGASANDLLMQFQADIVGCPVHRPEIRETTALGAACLAGLAAGLWDGHDELLSRWRLEKAFEPGMDTDKRALLTTGWRRAVERARGWENDQ